MASRTGGGKERASRIPLNYYKRRDAISRWKLGLSLVAALVAMGWWATGFSLGGPGVISENSLGRLRASHGPVARVHASWDARCEACHVPFQPIGQDAWTTKVGLSSREADVKCQSCHAVEDHHPGSQKAGDIALVACAGCHRDHRGRDASLVRLPDSDCTSCHAGLNAHTQSGASSYDSVITSFAGNHPEFDLIANNEGDLGTLKFNHALHMTPGLIEGPGQKPVFTVGQLSPEDRDRYAREGQTLADAVTLDCASCHRLDNGSMPPVSSPSGVESLATVATSGQGAYMKPISYRTDCAACHKLDVTVPLGKTTALITVPHRLQPSALHTMLTDASIRLTLGKDLKTLEAFTPSTRELPGKRNDAEQSARDEVQARVTKAERILLGEGKGTCTECHQYKTPRGLTSSLDPSTPLDEIQVEPTFVETVWYKHARFDHSAHRAVSCKSCHEAADPGASNPSRRSADVLIPGKSSCVQCHAPEGRGPGGLPTGGAGQTCVECHKYHGGEHIGPIGPTNSGSMTFTEFLRGHRGETP